MENWKNKAFVTEVSFHGNPEIRLLNSQFPALLTKAYFLRIHKGLIVQEIIIKESALLKTQHVNTESFPQNLLPYQPLIKMQ